MAESKDDAVIRFDSDEAFQDATTEYFEKRDEFQVVKERFGKLRSDIGLLQRSIKQYMINNRRIKQINDPKGNVSLSVQPMIKKRGRNKNREHAMLLAELGEDTVTKLEMLTKRFKEEAAQGTGEQELGLVQTAKQTITKQKTVKIA